MIVIGEKINVITNTIRAAMRERDKGPIQEMAVLQADAGADYLDVNIGPARKDGHEVMPWMVEVIQEAVDLPLSLDTVNADAIEAGLKVHKGKAIINSTDASRERMERLIPLAVEYNSFVIGLTYLAQPKDANDRCAYAADLLGAAMEFGLPLEDLILDPIFQSVCGMQEHAMEILKSVKMLTELNDPPMKIVCGLSNVSNGAPEKVRSVLNRVYMIMAIREGLSHAIMDPTDKDLMDTLKTHKVFQNEILYCHSYLDN